MKHFFAHHRITMNALIRTEALLLNLAGRNDTLADGGRGFTGLHLTQLCKRHSLYLAMDINSVQ